MRFSENEYANYSENVVGNATFSDANNGYKGEVKDVLESYQNDNTSIIFDMPAMLSNGTDRNNFIGKLTNSLGQSPIALESDCANSTFYGNYRERVEQLAENSVHSIAVESVISGYAPIVTYGPFWLKKQWIECVFKDVLMTEVPKKPVITLGYMKRYVKTQDGTEYPMPECFYDEEIIAKLQDDATGLNISEEPIDITELRNTCLINPVYIPGTVLGDHTAEITHNISIIAVVVKNSSNEDVTIPMNMTVDVSTHQFVNGSINITLADGTEVVDELMGRVDFVKSVVSITSATGAVLKVCLRGKTANRFNQRSISVTRRNQKIERTMPESGIRLNTPITIEDAADALATQNVDIIADNVDVMTRTMAEFEDFGIKNFLDKSYEANKAGDAATMRYNELKNEKMIVEFNYDALPHEGYGLTLTQHKPDAKLYFEKVVAAMKTKLRTTEMSIVAYCHPNMVTFLEDSVNWVLSNDTMVSGVKLSYNFGIFTSRQDRVHILTSLRCNEEDGIRFVAIPTTQELVTFKNYKYNMVVDRGYRDATYSLVPNIMGTQRTLTFEIFPLQGKLGIDNFNINAPSTLVRSTDVESATLVGDTGAAKPEAPGTPDAGDAGTDD